MRLFHYCLVHCFFGLTHWSLHLYIVVLNWLFNCAIAFILAHVWPSILNVWDRSFIYRGSIGRRELKKHFAGHSLAIKLLRAHFFEDLWTQLRHLVNELGAELLVCHTLQVLKLTLFFDGSNKGWAVTIREYRFYQTSNPVLMIDWIRVALLLMQWLFEVISWANSVTLLWQ